MNFNLQFNGVLEYKALKMTFGKGPLLPQKYNILQKRRKTTKVTLTEHDMNRERFKMSR